jgi:hypothetical protein
MAIGEKNEVRDSSSPVCLCLFNVCLCLLSFFLSRKDSRFIQVHYA